MNFFSWITDYFYGSNDSVPKKSEENVCSLNPKDSEDFEKELLEQNLEHLDDSIDNHVYNFMEANQELEEILKYEELIDTMIEQELDIHRKELIDDVIENETVSEHEANEIETFFGYSKEHDLSDPFTETPFNPKVLISTDLVEEIPDLIDLSDGSDTEETKKIQNQRIREILHIVDTDKTELANETFNSSKKVFQHKNSKRTYSKMNRKKQYRKKKN